MHFYLENELVSTPKAQEAIVSIVNLPKRSFKSTIPASFETVSSKMSTNFCVVTSMNTFIAFILPDVKMGENVDLKNVNESSLNSAQLSFKDLLEI